MCRAVSGLCGACSLMISHMCSGHMVWYRWPQYAGCTQQSVVGLPPSCTHSMWRLSHACAVDTWCGTGGHSMLGAPNCQWLAYLHPAHTQYGGCGACSLMISHICSRHMVWYRWSQCAGCTQLSVVGLPPSCTYSIWRLWSVFSDDLAHVQ